MFPDALTNLTTQQLPLIIAYAMMGLFCLVSLLAFFRYARRGAALNIALLVLFIGVYAGYFLFNVLRRTGAPTIEVTDIVISLFFLVYALSGIGSTMVESVEGSRSRLRDFGPLVTFFLASSFFFVDSIITLSTTAPSIGAWFGGWVATPENQLVMWVFRDSSKLIAFPLAAIVSMLYYLRGGRLERIVERAREDGETFDPDEVDEDIADATPDPGDPRTFPADDNPQHARDLAASRGDPHDVLLGVIRDCRARGVGVAQVHGLMSRWRAANEARQPEDVSPPGRLRPLPILGRFGL